MDIILDNKYNIVKTTDECIVKGSDNYDSLILKVPIECTNYYPTATFMRRDGRKWGPYICQNQTVDDTYRSFEWILTDNLLAVDGVLQITFTVNLTDTNGNVTKEKNVVEAFANIYDAVIVDDVILIGGENAVQNITEQLYLLQQQLDKYKEIWDAKVNVESPNGQNHIYNEDTYITLNQDNTSVLQLTSGFVRLRNKGTAIQLRETNGSEIRLIGDSIVKYSNSTLKEMVDDSMVITDTDLESLLVVK